MYEAVSEGFQSRRYVLRTFVRTWTKSYQVAVHVQDIHSSFIVLRVRCVSPAKLRLDRSRLKSDHVTSFRPIDGEQGTCNLYWTKHRYDQLYSVVSLCVLAVDIGIHTCADKHQASTNHPTPPAYIYYMRVCMCAQGNWLCVPSTEEAHHQERLRDPFSRHIVRNRCTVSHETKGKPGHACRQLMQIYWTPAFCTGGCVCVCSSISMCICLCVCVWNWCDAYTLLWT